MKKIAKIHVVVSHYLFYNFISIIIIFMITARMVVSLCKHSCCVTTFHSSFHIVFGFEFTHLIFGQHSWGDWFFLSFFFLLHMAYVIIFHWYWIRQLSSVFWEHLVIDTLHDFYDEYKNKQKYNLTGCLCMSTFDRKKNHDRLLTCCCCCNCYCRMSLASAPNFHTNTKGYLLW